MATPYPAGQGPLSAWPYRTGDPNRSETERAGEASLAFKLFIHDRKDIEAVAEELGISRATAYRRVHAHAALHDQPARAIRQLRSEAELELLRTEAWRVLQGDASIADKLNAIKELRMLDISGRRLYAVDEVPAPVEPPEPPPAEPDNWVDGARAEADAELVEVERRLRARLNGEGSGV